MARPRAADHEDKRQAMLDRTAELFAAHGYDRASTAMVAEALGVSKAPLYHCYKDKSELLFDVLGQHLQRLVQVVRGAADERFPPCERLENIGAALLDAYRDADAVHRVQLTCLALLLPKRQEALKALERALVDEVAGVLLEMSPELRRDRRLLKPVVMSFFAMLNWHYMWRRDRGALSRFDYARLAAAPVAEGLPGAAALLREEEDAAAAG